MTDAIDAGLPIEHRLRIAYEAARNRQDCGSASEVWSVLDGLWSRLQARLHAVERMRDNPNVTRQQIAAE